MRHSAITTHQFQTDDNTIGVVAELVESRLKSLTLRIGGSGRTPADITPGQLQELAEITAKAVEELRALGVAGLKPDEPKMVPYTLASDRPVISKEPFEGPR